MNIAPEPHTGLQGVALARGQELREYEAHERSRSSHAGDDLAPTVLSPFLLAMAAVLRFIASDAMALMA